MKKYIWLIGIILIAQLLLIQTVVGNSFKIYSNEVPKLPFSKGVGFSQAFESGTSVYDIRFQYYTRKDFINVKKLGIDQVRLPIFMSNMLDENGQFHDLFFYLLDQYVDIAEEEGVNLILTNMSGFDYSDEEGVRIQFLNIWTQMAQHYKNHSNLIHYELANEPSGISDEAWGQIQGEVITAIREIDPTHTILVTPASWGSIYGLKFLPVYGDENLIYVFHCYDPFLFTHQGAESQGFDELIGVPFPYDANRMPTMPSSFAGTWDEGRYIDYQTEGNADSLRALIDEAAAFKNERNVRLWCGEFGADDQFSNINDRAFWYETIRTALEENGIGWSMHGYTRYWGLFDYGTDKLFDYDLNIPIVEAMGLNTQPQSEFIIQPETSGFDIYTDYLSSDIDAWISSDDSLSHFYSEQAPKEGKFCIQMKDFPIWSMFDLNFKPNKDLSQLVENGYCLDFWIRGDSSGAKFNVRFLDTDTDVPEDHPWRMVHDIDETLALWDGEWHHIQIPLSDFVEQGAADDDTWFDPEGQFDWSAVDDFQIQTEYEGLEGKQFWFDNIRITQPDVVETTQVTFRVDMQNEVVSSSGVYLIGSFCNWNTANAISLLANDSVYSTTLQLTPGETVEYKFVNGAADEWTKYEIITGTCAYGSDMNRMIVVPDNDLTLDLVCFESCSTCVPPIVSDSVNVTFRVDLQYETISSSGIHLNGSFCNWTPTNAVKLTDAGTVYSTTLKLKKGETIEYKFVNGAPDDWVKYEIITGQECALGNDANRGLVVPENDLTLELVCFESCSTCNALVGITTDITFQVDMKNENVSGEGVFMKIYLEGEQVRYPFEMSNNGSIYSVTIGIIPGLPFQYNFVNGDASNQNNFEIVSGSCSVGNGHRYYEVPDNDATLNLVCFGSCESCPTGISSMSDDLIAIYPNPVENCVFITGLNNFYNCEVKLVDVSGKIIYSQKLVNECELSVDMTSLPNGSYSIIVVTVSEQIVKKIVKQ